MDKLKTIIIDDELHCTETLTWQLKKYCPEVDLVATCSTPEKGIETITEISPDLIFLDIDMPRISGFDLLASLNQITFGIIFTTAYDQFAVQAFKVSAIDYLIKPVDDDELKVAVHKAVQQKGQNIIDPIEHLLEQIQQKKISKRVVFPTIDGLEFVNTEDIVHCESDSNYTTVHFADQSKMVISKTLKDIQEILVDEMFFRVHNSHLVNMNYVKKYLKGDGGHLIMSNDVMVPVSRSRKQDLLNFIK